MNLASDEYFKAVDTTKIKAKIYTIGFKELRNGQYKVISFNAKRARGSMANYIVQHRLETIDDLRNFKMDNYLYNETLSTKFNLVFTR